MTREPYYQDDLVTLYAGDCIEVLAELPDNSVDSVTTDPPYGLEFMGKDWDSFKGANDWAQKGDTREWSHRPLGGTDPFNGRDRPRFTAGQPFQAWCQLWAAECLRILKPGGHLLAFGGTRTSHRLACGIEDAGFEMRPAIAWLYASGFPKSLDVSKAIDRRPGVTQHTRFAAHLAERREAAGLSRADVSERVVGTRSGACWNWEHHQFPEAKWWPALRNLLDLDGETWDVVIAEAEREKTSTGTSGKTYGMGGLRGFETGTGEFDVTAPATPEAEQWQGWGTALKPAFEPVVVARKPLSGTVAANVLRWGTGALNIDATRIGSQPGSVGSKSGGSSVCTCPSPEDDRTSRTPSTRRPASSGASPVGHSDPPPNGAAGALDSSEPLGSLAGYPTSPRSGGEPPRPAEADGQAFARPLGDALGPLVPRATASRIPMGRSTPCPHHTAPNVEGRWPANVALDESQAAALDQMSGEQRDGAYVGRNRNPAETANEVYGPFGKDTTDAGFGSSGGASRFYFTAADEHAEVCDPWFGKCPVCGRESQGDDYHGPYPHHEPTPPLLIESMDSRFSYTAKAGSEERITHNGVSHPTVKPLALMRWLARLVTPPGGLILEPFAGSGTTVEAALLEGFRCIAIEREADYLPLITQRINRRRDPIAYITAAGQDLGLFGDGVA